MSIAKIRRNELANSGKPKQCNNLAVSEFNFVFVHDDGLKHLEVIALPSYLATNIFVQRPFLFRIKMLLDLLLGVGQLARRAR